MGEVGEPILQRSRTLYLYSICEQSYRSQLQLLAGRLNEQTTSEHVHALVPSAMISYWTCGNDRTKVNISKISVDDPELVGMGSNVYKEMPVFVALGENLWWLEFRE